MEKKVALTPCLSSTSRSCGVHATFGPSSNVIAISFPFPCVPTNERPKPCPVGETAL